MAEISRYRDTDPVTESVTLTVARGCKSRGFADGRDATATPASVSDFDIVTFDI